MCLGCMNPKCSADVRNTLRFEREIYCSIHPSVQSVYAFCALTSSNYAPPLTHSVCFALKPNFSVSLRELALKCAVK